MGAAAGARFLAHNAAAAARGLSGNAPNPKILRTEPPAAIAPPAGTALSRAGPPCLRAGMRPTGSPRHVRDVSHQP